MDIFKKIQELFAEILDIERNEISPDTYIFGALGTESIDLMELAVEINSEFNIDVIDDDIFLRRLREYISDIQTKNRDKSQSEGCNPVAYIKRKYPFLSEKRIIEIIKDIEGELDFDKPILKVKDIVDYVYYWQKSQNQS